MYGNKKIFTDTVIALCFIITGAVFCFIVGKDASWDLYNYHFYSGWAIFNERIGYDIMPCGIQSFYNPTGDIPLYLMVKYLNNHPYIIEFIQSSWWGICAFLVYKISMLVFTGKYRIFYVICSVIISMTGVVSICETGLCWNDLTVSSFVLAGLYIFFKNFCTPTGTAKIKNLFIACVLIGLSSGIKLTGLMFIAGFFLSVLILHKEYSLTKKHILAMMGGFIVGFSITGLWWHIYMYIKFKNPFFPLFNNIFKSPYALPESHALKRYFPKTQLQYLFYPFYWIQNEENYQLYVWEAYFRDFRPVFVYVITVIYILVMALKNKFTNRIKEVEEEMRFNIIKFLTLFILISYIIWINMYGNIRFIVPVEHLSGIYIISVLIFLIKNHIEKLIASVTVIAILFCTTVTQNHTYERESFSNKFLKLKNLNLPDNAVVLLCGGFPASIYIPFQNPKARFIYLYGEAGDYHFIYPEKIKNKIKDIINDKSNKVYLIYNNSIENAQKRITSEYINIEDFECRYINKKSFRKHYICTKKE